MVLSFQGADSGGSSSGNGSGAVPAAPAGGSRSSSRNLGSSSGEKEEGKKARRQWESWSTEDKNTFFEGLYEVSSGARTGGRKSQSLSTSSVFLFLLASALLTTWLQDLLGQQFSGEPLAGSRRGSPRPRTRPLTLALYPLIVTSKS